MCEKRKKENEGQSDMGENIGAHRKFPQYLPVKQETSALCHVQKSDPTETNVSRASRVKQDSQFHTVDKGDILSEWKILYRARILRSGVAVDPGEQESY